MALFGRKKAPARTTNVVQSGGEEKNVVASGTSLQAASPHAEGQGSDVLRNPRITEKATMHGARGIYTFDVSESSTKRSISEAVFRAYSVRPRKIAIVHIPRKVRRSARSGKRGVAHGGKKAYVYLKKGDTITIG